MEWRRLSAWSHAILLAILLPAIPGSAALGNHASVEVVAPDSAAAVCQVFLLVNSIVILEMEDSLGLVALPPLVPIEARLGVSAMGASSDAACSTLIERVAVYAPTPLALGRSFVSGPALAAAPAALGTGAGSDVAICQYALLLDSVVIGGGAYGLPTGHGRGLVAATLASSEGGRATCEAGVRDLAFVEAAG